jgi:hypothetical protein
MPAQSTKININLLPTEDLEKSTTGRFLKWALSIGRYIVIFTEFVVLMAFLSRFWLDRTLSDLHESIGQKQAIIKSAQVLELQARSIQNRLLEAGKIVSSNSQAEKILDFLGKSTPVDMVYDNLTISNNQVLITASALSELSLAVITYNMKNSKLFTKINLDNVEKNKKQQGEITFTIIGKLN